MTYHTPTISVICATYNRPKTLLRLLDQLNDQRCVDFRAIDCCVVDDGSDMGKRAFDLEADVSGMCKFDFNYIYRERHPQNLARVYSARNLAASCTHGEY